MPRDLYERNVFINCPFDEAYVPIFDAVVFTVHDAGFRPLSARARMNSGEVRLGKLVQLIGMSRYSIHDLSRTEMDDRSLPRFNMPLELGIVIGCINFGTGRHQRKSMLIMDRERYRYQAFVSDIAGQDIAEHGDQPETAIEKVRNWLRTESGDSRIPGAEFITERYRRFRDELPQIASVAKLNAKHLTFVDYSHLIAEWLKVNTH
jgi:hypothetical protein